MASPLGNGIATEMMKEKEGVGEGSVWVMEDHLHLLWQAL